MTLDDAIAAFGQIVSDDFDSAEFDVRDYERLVEWLTELKSARESAFSDIGLAARAVSENHRLKAENDKLRELVADAMAALRVAEDELGRDVMVAHYPLLHIRMRELGVEVD